MNDLPPAETAVDVDVIQINGPRHTRVNQLLNIQVANCLKDMVSLQISVEVEDTNQSCVLFIAPLYIVDNEAVFAVRAPDPLSLFGMDEDPTQLGNVWLHISIVTSVLEVATPTKLSIIYMFPVE